MKKFLTAAVVALAVAAPASASSFKGVVVANGHGTLAIAAPSGAVQMVRSSSHARVGSIVRVSGSSVAVVGRAHHARIRGVVVRRAASTRFIAAGTSLLAVRARRGLAAVAGPPITSSTTPSASTPGTVVQDEVEIDDQGNLNEQSSTPVGQAPTTQVTAVVASLGTGTITLTVNGQTLTLPLPAGLTLPASTIGTTVTLTLNLGSGAPSVTPGSGSGGDDGGDNNDDNGDNGNGSGGGGGGDD